MSQKDGFSIDRPVALRTLFAAGFVMLKVASSSGEELICLDGRKGAWDEAFHNRSANWMTCRDFNADLLENVRDADLEIEERESKNKVLLIGRGSSECL